jgi:EAL domain-containing protein (putative c-di-GMP-specific phosphodiesterase class I)
MPNSTPESPRILDQDILRAVDRAQLRVHYQPKVRVRDEAWDLAGVEALLRWEHPDHGLIYPDEFIGIAEGHGMIAALTDFVLQTGVDQLSEWDQAGFSTNLSINMSPRLVSDSDFPDRLDEMLSVRSIDPGRLAIEVTESATIEEPLHTLDILTRLRLKGFDLSLDDFGTGQSPLTQLYKMPFSELKLDRTLGFDIPHEGQACTIVRALVDLAHNLGLKVCCEGVESEAALQFLHRSGCDYAQGYHIARPMAAEALPAWSKDWTGKAALRELS